MNILLGSTLGTIYTEHGLHAWDPNTQEQDDEKLKVTPSYTSGSRSAGATQEKQNKMGEDLKIQISWNRTYIFLKFCAMF